NAGKRRVALLVDSIVSQQEIVAKPLGPHLRDVRGVAGAAVLGNGQVVVILELHELLAEEPRGTLLLPDPGARPPQPAPALGAAGSASSSSQPAARSSLPAAQEPGGGASVGRTTWTSARPTEPTLRHDFIVAQPESTTSQHRVVVPPSTRYGHVLVVDDSPSVRRVVGNMPKSYGWEGQTARDGAEALESIARQMPAAVLLDIEMPRMDGYELMATLRSQEQYRPLPLIVLTSRAATKHQ